MISNSFADKLMAVWQSSRLCPKYIKTIIAHRESDIERNLLPNYLEAHLPYLQNRGRFNLLHIAGDK